MAQKTYVFSLRKKVREVNRYMTRWQPQLSENLTAPQYTALQAAILAMNELIAELGAQPYNP